MTDPTVLRIQDWLREHENELLQDTLRMLQIPSVQSEPAPGAPFGSGNRAALDFALKLANDAGMETKDLEGYIGYAEIGSGDRLILSLGHLDVVPVGDGWKHEPFGAQVEDGYIYARGAVDDKGPTMASFYAVKAIQAVVPDLPARIRQVFGCNEESGFACVHRYAQVEEPPTYGIAPDSSWPLVHAEKGIASLVVTVPLNLKSPMQLLELTGGQRPNIVIDAAGAKVRVHSTLRAQVEERLKSAWDKNVGWEWEGDVLSLTARGKAAHGMQPFKGDNAATRMLRFLVELSPLEAQDYFESLLLSTDAGGVGLGIHGRDDASGDLTSNLGLVATGEGNLTLTFNVRYPTTWKGEDVRTRCESHLRVTRPDWKVRSFTDSPSLYFPLDHPLVQAIRDVYTHETGDNSEPGTTGGGTYARALPNTVSIGTGWAGDGEPHENDERLKIEHLFRMARIYAHILYRLATMT